VVEGALDDPVSLIASPRETVATVLFTDMRGFTAWCEGRSPQEVLWFLNHLLSGQTEAVRRHGGMVDKFLGDGLLAVFGVLEVCPDHADRALQAAREMCAALVGFNGELREAGLPDAQVGVGIHTGPLIVGCLGQASRLEFTILGDTVNTASRLPSLTLEKTMMVLLTGDTAAACKRTHDILPLGEVTVRGRQAPLSIYGLRPASGELSLDGLAGR
jgi:adenylate cyclase